MFTIGVPSMTILCVYPGRVMIASGRKHHMNVVLIFATGCLALLVVAFGVVFAKLFAQSRPSQLSENPAEIFSPARYRAMERVLDEEDRNFLRSQPGWNWQKEKRFRKSRIQ